MTVVIDDQLLGALLRGEPVAVLDNDDEVLTTGCWYVRLCQAVIRADSELSPAGPGPLSRPFDDLPDDLRSAAVNKVLELPERIGLMSWRTLGPSIGSVRTEHRLNLLGAEALAAALRRDARLALATPSPALEAAARLEGVHVTVSPRS